MRPSTTRRRPSTPQASASLLLLLLLRHCCRRPGVPLTARVLGRWPEKPRTLREFGDAKLQKKALAEGEHHCSSPAVPAYQAIYCEFTQAERYIHPNTWVFEQQKKSVDVVLLSACTPKAEPYDICGFKGVLQQAIFVFSICCVTSPGRRGLACTPPLRRKSGVHRPHYTHGSNLEKRSNKPLACTHTSK